LCVVSVSQVDWNFDPNATTDAASIASAGEASSTIGVLFMTSAAPACSILVVEDEMMIRMMMSDMLEDLGHGVSAEAGDVAEASKLAETAKFDLAILDMNLNGQTVIPVAEILETRGLPFIFATGYGAGGLPEKFRNRPALQKPFKMDTLKQAIDEAMKPAS
jgi:CheY-like chemotaxis protein